MELINETYFFIKNLRKNLEENLSMYINIFDETPRDEITDEYWNEVIMFYDKLSSSERKVLFKMLNQIQVDATANLLAILDGVIWLENQDEEFKLTTIESNEVINGDLHNIFLEMEEDS